MMPIMAKAIGYMKPDIDHNLRLYVPFNEGTGSVAKDYSQYGNHAQLTDVEWSNEGFNGAGKFNSTSSYGDCGTGTSLNITGDFTIMAWVEINNLSTNSTIYCRGEANIEGIYILIYSTGLLAFKTNQAAALQSTESDFNEIAINTKYCLVITRKGTIGKIYKNKVDVTHTPGTHLDSASSTKNSYVGKYEVNAHYFNGIIVEIRIYNQIPSIAQIAADCYEIVYS